MNQEDIIRMAREAGLHRQQHNLMSNPVQYRFSYEGYEENLERFAALVAQRVLAGNYPEMIAIVAAAAKAEEREAIMDEWWMCVQSDLENGVKSLNERAAEKWKKEYPEISKFAETIRARGETK